MHTGTENIFRTAEKDEADIFLADESLNTKTAGLCDLLILFEADSLQIALLEKKENRFLALEYFSFRSESEAGLSEEREKHLRNSAVLRNYEFSGVKAAVFSPVQTLVPEAMYKKEHVEKLLRFNCAFDDKLLVFSDNLSSQQAHILYGIEPQTIQTLEHLFEEPEIHHPLCCMTEALSMLPRSKKEKEISLHFRKKHLDVFVFEGRNLLMCNSYECKTAEDFLYYSLFIFDQLELDPSSTSTLLLGEIESESALYKILANYIRNLRFSDRSGNSGYSYVFNKLPSHRHFSVFSLSLCE
ncbi:MAG: DUF3822 family protein [Bacteroidetes bacterium]|nr:MAG: DUF3822 family protein [Bacteroidota bacterium]REK00358.1 MAG: DUF3822 family protein [Bacteroidota bacterium]REK35477.1 MAG: DUF3822 family protein [Bacteroidota bacterium]REK46839.1 MAG: DUF3822 family protein [Bacteroidota bacterium]